MPDFVDPYIDPDTKILKNKVGAKTLEELRAAEGDIISLIDATMSGIPHTKYLAELKAIHKKLFGKIYDWAGELRTVDIRKGGEEYFLDCTFLERGAKYVLDELSTENFLQELNKEDFVKRLAYFFEQLNFVHPFREGNGRTQRIFWQRIANDAGYFIDWQEVVGDEMDQACMAGRINHDLAPLEIMLERIVKKPNI